MLFFEFVVSGDEAQAPLNDDSAAWRVELRRFSCWLYSLVYTVIVLKQLPLNMLSTGIPTSWGFRLPQDYVQPLA